MKKIQIILLSLTCMAMATACNAGDKNNTKDAADQTDKAPGTSVTSPADDIKEDGSEPEDTKTDGTDSEETKDGGPVDLLGSQDFYPLKADTEYVYEGSGNEYASFTTYVDYLDPTGGRLQTRTNNGGTETVRVLEFKDGKLYITRIVNESYYRDNLLDSETEGEAEILLMEPLVPGTGWTLPDGRKRTITAADVLIDTPTGKYQALEVTTEGEDSTTKDYYAKNTGLVKSVFTSGDLEVSSTLSSINKDVPLTRDIIVYYPDSDGNIYTESKSISFRTNDITREVLSEALKAEVPKPSHLPLLSKNANINSLYLGEDRIVYLDLSSEFIKESNTGAGFEQLLLQSIANTFGMYYSAEEIYLTIDGKPYESGHILLKKGETIKVNLDQVITE